MSAKMKLNILTPEKTFFSGDILELNTVTVTGNIGILPEHSPLVAVLKPSETRIKLEDGSIKSLFTSSGILKVTKTDIEIIADASEWPEEIDVKRAEEAKKRAEDRINKAGADKIDVRRAEIALERALARIKIKGI